jgi:hypothetical protein
MPVSSRLLYNQTTSVFHKSWIYMIGGYAEPSLVEVVAMPVTHQRDRCSPGDLSMECTQKWYI